MSLISSWGGKRERSQPSRRGANSIRCRRFGFAGETLLGAASTAPEAKRSSLPPSAAPKTPQTPQIPPPHGANLAPPGRPQHPRSRRDAAGTVGAQQRPLAAASPTFNCFHLIFCCLPFSPVFRNNNSNNAARRIFVSAAAVLGFGAQGWGTSTVPFVRGAGR